MSREVESMDTSSDEVDDYFQGFSLDNPEFVYKMKDTKRGKFIIINNKTFRPETGMSERFGADNDAANLKEILVKLGFDVELKDNLTKIEMLKLILQATAAKVDHSNSDCFGMAILSYGDKGDDKGLYGTDGTMPIKNIMDPFIRCKGLNGKPKIFLFQACGGKELDSGKQFPLQDDILCVYSTVPGSWFVEALTQALSKPDSKKMDFISILTRVNHAIACQFKPNASQPDTNRQMEVPSILSTLTKDLFLNPN